MKKSLVTCCSFFYFSKFCICTIHGIKCIGDIVSEWAQKILKSRFGGYILTGQTNSQDFGSTGEEDYNGSLNKDR
jgi:hypothetical protein